jgi:hypothetical protein
LTQQRQGLVCWHTRDYNEGWEDYCEKCDNTGWYRLHNLYRFVFEIGGRRYVWHQPESLVTWPVTVTDPDVGEYKEYISEPTGFTTTLGNLYRATLYQYLLGQGISRNELPPVSTLKSALRDEWYWNISWPISRWWYELRWWVKERPEWLAYWLEKQAELKVGDMALAPNEPRQLVKILKIGLEDYWPYGSDRLADCEYTLNGHLPKVATWCVEELQPVGLRVKAAKRLLGVVNRIRMDGLDEDEIPF